MKKLIIAIITIITGATTASAENVCDTQYAPLHTECYTATPTDLPFQTTYTGFGKEFTMTDTEGCIAHYRAARDSISAYTDYAAYLEAVIVKISKKPGKR